MATPTQEPFWGLKYVGRDVRYWVLYLVVVEGQTFVAAHQDLIQLLFLRQFGCVAQRNDVFIGSIQVVCSIECIVDTRHCCGGLCVSIHSNGLVYRKSHGQIFRLFVFIFQNAC